MCDLDQITKSWGLPKTKQEKEVMQKCIDLLRSIVEKNDLPYIWEAFLIQNDVSVSLYERWKEKYKNKSWFKNAITDVKMLFADRIVRDAKILGAENMKYLLQRVIEDASDDQEIIVREFVEVKNA